MLRHAQAREAIATLCLAITILGALALSRIPVDILPSVDIPVVVIVWNGRVGSHAPHCADARGRPELLPLLCGPVSGAGVPPDPHGIIHNP